MNREVQNLTQAELRSALGNKHLSDSLLIAADSAGYILLEHHDARIGMNAMI